ncbi:MAG: sigma-70 family RNA polymerase sigma factor [Rhodopseudomonas sp.]|uniref:RNA polymerase sigma factor n=1 Tax=Rhodopseudomonas sp. TaxID=1078 RepID=UPI0017D582EF|nr:sigma-70 family RNA polymerase sigma factor [Rhodopseudomonas sp.]NVN85963.1 sigma-70 family RNA polymerase sigma factor [Rhodopseudomonas sp.]
MDTTSREGAQQQGARDMLLQLLDEVARGNKSAFAKLYGATNRKLHGVALRILKDRGVAEDVLQEAYLKIWRNAANYDPAVASPIAWMATIVRYAAIDVIRKRQFETVASETEMLAIASNDPDPLDELDLAQRRPWALTAFARLAPDKRRLILLAYLQEFSRQQLSQRMGVPANTVKTHLRRALLELQASVGDHAKATIRKAP